MLSMDLGTEIEYKRKLTDESLWNKLKINKIIHDSIRVKLDVDVGSL